MCVLDPGDVLDKPGNACQRLQADDSTRDVPVVITMEGEFTFDILTRMQMRAECAALATREQDSSTLVIIMRLGLN